MRIVEERPAAHIQQLNEVYARRSTRSPRSASFAAGAHEVGLGCDPVDRWDHGARDRRVPSSSTRCSPTSGARTSRSWVKTRSAHSTSRSRSTTRTSPGSTIRAPVLARAARRRPRRDAIRRDPEASRRVHARRDRRRVRRLATARWSTASRLAWPGRVGAPHRALRHRARAAARRVRHAGTSAAPSSSSRSTSALDVVVHAVDGGYYALLAMTRSPAPLAIALDEPAHRGGQLRQGDGVKRAPVLSSSRSPLAPTRARRAARRHERLRSAQRGVERHGELRRARRGHGLRGHVGRARSSGATCRRTTSCSSSIPLQRVDPNRLAAFVQAGGNVVIADDFGEGKDAMSRPRLIRADVTTPDASATTRTGCGRRSRPRKGDHPIAHEVDEVVTNHPAALTHVEGATVVVAFDEGALVVAGEHGSGTFVAISDPSIFINRMQQFPGNVAARGEHAAYLDRGGTARHVVLLRGDVPMYGDPRPFIDDPRGRRARSLDRRAQLLARGAPRLAAHASRDEGTRGRARRRACSVLALFALPVRRGPRIDGAWLKFGRPARRDEPHSLVAAAEHQHRLAARPRVRAARSGPGAARRPSRAARAAVHGARGRARRAVSSARGHRWPASRSHACTAGCARCRAVVKRRRRGARARSRVAISTPSTEMWPSCVVLSGSI